MRRTRPCHRCAAVRFRAQSDERGRQPEKPYGPMGYNVTFRRLLPDDPAVKVYKGVQRAPNIVVEQRNR